MFCIYLPYLTNPYISSGRKTIISLCQRDWGARKLSNLPRIILVISDRAGLWSRAVWWWNCQAKAACIRPLWSGSLPGLLQRAGASGPSPRPSAVLPDPPLLLLVVVHPPPHLQPAGLLKSQHASGCSQPELWHNSPGNSPVKGKGPIRCELFLL